MLFDVIQILSTGTCPDRNHPFTFALSDELLVTDEILSRAGVGYFHHQTGLAVEGRLDSCYPEYGVVPGTTAEYFKPEE